MGNYVVGIGGTGAKFIEALTFLSSSGVMPEGHEKLHIMFVDPDVGNGNLERTRLSIDFYNRSKSLGFGGDSTLFKTEIQTSNPDVWSPVTDKQALSLTDIFDYNILKANDNTKNIAHLIDVLFSPAERTVELDKGFRGHPSIGSAVLANTLKLTNNEPWGTFRSLVLNELNNGHQVNVFLAGSIFGGTGAAGFPTIGELLKKELTGVEEIRLGGALALPYFSFIADDSTVDLRASSEDFLVNTQASLGYYLSRNDMEIFDVLYLTGEENMCPVSQFSIGANTQKNEAHFLEVFMGLAAIDFFSAREGGCYIVGRKNTNEIEWSDIPYPDGYTVFKRKVAQFTRFAYVYVNIYFPDIEAIRNGTCSKSIPWHQDYFIKKGQSVMQENIYQNLLCIKEFCQRYLEWFEQIHSSYTSGTVSLLNKKALAEGSRQSFSELVLPYTKPDNKELGNIWRVMSKYKNKYQDASVAGIFLNSLYEGCSI